MVLTVTQAAAPVMRLQGDRTVRLQV